MGIGARIQRLRAANGLTQEQIAEKLNVSRQSVSKWELDTAIPETEKVILMSKLFSVSIDQLLLEETDIKKIRPQTLHLGSIYLIARDFEKSIEFYEKLLSMKVTNRNCGNKFAQFFFDNKCLAIMNESNIKNHCYSNGDYKFVLNFWVEDLDREFERLKSMQIGSMTDIIKAHDGYYYFHVYDADDNVVEITGEFQEYKENEYE